MYENPDQKRKDRSGFAGWCAKHPKLVVAMGLVLLLVGSCIVADRRATQSFHAALDKLHEEGAPTTLADLNAMGADIPDDENMAIPLLAAAGQLIADPIPPERNSQLPLIGTRRLPLVGHRMPSKHRETTDWYLSKHVDELIATHQAVSMERGHLPVEWKRPMLNVPTTFTGHIRQLSRSWVLEAIVAAEDGHPAEAMSAIRDLLRLDRTFQGNASLIELLSRVACRTSAFMAIERVLGLCELDDATLQTLEKLLAEEAARFDFQKAMEVERVLTLDLIEAALSRKAPSDPSMPMPSLVSYIPLLKSYGNEQGLEAYSGLVDAIGEPNRQTLDRLHDAAKRLNSLPLHCLLWKAATPSVHAACCFWMINEAQARAMRVVIACERYRLANGDWPKALAELVPAYLSDVPLDPFDGQPIRYKRIERGVLIWSISKDMVDDQGDVRWKEGRSSADKLRDTGFVILDPQYRGTGAEAD